MRIGSLFTGYGGLDLAVEAAFGATTAWVSDIKPAACKLLAHRMPDVPNLGDITTVDWSQVPRVTIVTGGSPCQDLSTAGRLAGMTEGTRSNLWVQMREAIAHVRPRYVVWENVRGAYSAAADSAVERCPGCLGDGHDGPVLRALGRVLGDLADLGYDAQWRGLRAADVGAPHGRFRVFVLAAHARSIEPERRRGYGLLAGAPGADEGRAGGRQRDGGPAGDRGATPADAGHGLLAEWTWPAGRGASQRPPVRGESGRHCEGPVEGPAGWGPYAPAIRRWERVTGNPAPAPVDDRGRLNPALPEWMMGLPPGWITDVPGMSRPEALSLAGDGVVPQQAYAALVDMLTTPVVAESLGAA